MKISARESRRSAFVESGPLLFDCLTAPNCSKTLRNIWIGIQLIQTIFAMLKFWSVTRMAKLRCFAISERQTGSSEPRPP